MFVKDYLTVSRFLSLFPLKAIKKSIKLLSSQRGFLLFKTIIYRQVTRSKKKSAFPLMLRHCRIFVAPVSAGLIVGY